MSPDGWEIQGMRERTVYEFGVFRFDTEQCLLMDLNNKPLRISKCKEDENEGVLGKSHCPLLLLFLRTVIENRSREIVLTEGNLINAGWPVPNQTIEIAKNTLRRTLGKLKKILKEHDPKKPNYIKGVRGGYKFMFEVKELPVAEIRRPDYPGNMRAKEKYAWGLHLLDTFTTEDGLQKAIKDFQQAYKIVPGYAEAYAHEALAHLWLSIFSWRAPQQNTLPQALRASEQALHWDTTLGVAYAANAFAILFNELDQNNGWKKAEGQLEKAIELDNKYHQKFAAVYQMDALMKIAKGQFNKATLTIERSLEINPVSFISNVLKALILFVSRDYYSCGNFLQEINSHESDIDAAYYIRVLVCIYKGEHARALEEIEQGEKMAEGNVLYKLLRAHWLVIWGSKDDALNLLKRLDEKTDNRRYISPYHRALPYVHIDHDKAIEGLERAASEKDPWVFLLHVDPRVDLLRRNERFIALVHRLGLDFS